MVDDSIVEVRNITKCYRIFAKNSDRLLQRLAFNKKKYYREFLALHDISFDVYRGETIGIIGCNGAGKSTLLQIICGIVTPTSGHINVRGRIAALLELGSGFNMEFTGRENIYLNATILGLSRREIDNRIDAIIEFADIGDYVDQPVKNYSSGMYVRLAFAVIAHVDADILIIDEALSVGDVFFQQKCMRFLQKFKENKGTVILVSHDMGAITAFCHKTIFLSREGGVYRAMQGKTDDMVKVYLETLYKHKELVAQSDDDGSIQNTAMLATHKNEISAGNVRTNIIQISSFNKESPSFGNKSGEICNAYFSDSSGSVVTRIDSQDIVKLILEINVHEAIISPGFGFILKDRLGQYLVSEETEPYFRHKKITFQPQDGIRVEFKFAPPVLMRGDYTLTLAFSSGIGDDHVQIHWIHDALVLTSVGDRLINAPIGVNGLSMTIYT